MLAQRWPRDARYVSGSNEPLRRYGHLKLSKMAACRQLGNSAIRSADPENPTLEPSDHRSPVAEICPFAYLVGIWNLRFGGKGAYREVAAGQRLAPFERAMVVSYRLSIVLSVTIRPQFAIECLRRSNQQGGGSLCAQISGCPHWSRPLVFGANISVMVKLFRKYSNLCDHNPPTSQTDEQTDRQTTCDRKTALCSKVHHAVKSDDNGCAWVDILEICCKNFIIIFLFLRTFGVFDVSLCR